MIWIWKVFGLVISVEEEQMVKPRQQLPIRNFFYNKIPYDNVSYFSLNFQMFPDCQHPQTMLV